MRIFQLVYPLGLIILLSCTKETFPERSDIIGVQVEQTNNSFRHKLIFEEEKVYFFKQTLVDTLFYWLDKNQEKLFLQHPIAGQSVHKILFNKKQNELKIWGLFPSSPQKLSETVFKKQ